MKRNESNILKLSWDFYERKRCHVTRWKNFRCLFHHFQHVIVANRMCVYLRAFHFRIRRKVLCVCLVCSSYSFFSIFEKLQDSSTNSSNTQQTKIVHYTSYYIKYIHIILNRKPLVYNILTEASYRFCKFPAKNRSSVGKLHHLIYLFFFFSGNNSPRSFGTTFFFFLFSHTCLFSFTACSCLFHCYCFLVFVHFIFFSRLHFIKKLYSPFSYGFIRWHT